MGREIRKVPQNWIHPTSENGNLKPLYEGYEEAAAEFLTTANKEGLSEALEYMGCPDKADYMPDWKDEEKTYLMMYETTTEGTPLSPAMETPEKLAQWLADNNASSFGSCTATYEQWLGMIRSGWAPSAVLSSKGLQSGVEALSD